MIIPTIAVEKASIKKLWMWIKKQHQNQRQGVFRNHPNIYDEACSKKC